MNNKLKIIREKCVVANPEIVELKPGCEVMVGDKNPKPLRHTIYEVNLEGIYFAYLNRPFPADLEANDFYDCEFAGETKGVQILGRPIRLADVLLTLHQFRGSFNHDIDMVERSRWNLRADDLEKQSEETINFLAVLAGGRTFRLAVIAKFGAHGALSFS
jgi:hypothetical protein